LNYGFANYSISTPVEKNEKIANLAVMKGVSDNIDIVTAKHFTKLMPKGNEMKFEREVLLPESVKAPLTKGDVAGEMVLKANGNECARIPLVYTSNVDKIGLGSVYLKILKYWSGNRDL